MARKQINLARNFYKWMEVQRVRKRILTQKIKREKRQNQYIGRSEEDKVREKVDGRNEGRKDLVQTNKIPTFTDERHIYQFRYVNKS